MPTEVIALKSSQTDVSHAFARKYVKNFRANLKKDKLGYFQKQTSARKRKRRTVARMTSRFSRVVHQVAAMMPAVSRSWSSVEEFFKKADKKPA